MNLKEIIQEEFEKIQTDYPDIIGKTLKLTTTEETEFRVKKIIYNQKNDPDNIVLYGNLIRGNHEYSGESLHLPLEVFKKLYNTKHATWKSNKYQYKELEF